MRTQTRTLLASMAVVWLAASPAAARTDCQTNVTAVCVELAGNVGAYRSLLWAMCDADNATVCSCYDAQKVESGVDWCQWVTCACEATADTTLKGGLCGLASACTTVATVKKQQRQAVADSAPSGLAQQAEQVLAGQVVDCSPEACATVGGACTRAEGALSILKAQGAMASGAACQEAARDAAAFAKRLHVDGLTPAIGACACAAVF